jgi:flagellar biogenesis protein FliO
MFLAARSMLAEFGPMVAKSALVLALIALGAFTLKRFFGPRLAVGKKSARMRVVERLALEPRLNLYLVDIDGREFIIGFSEKGVAFHALGNTPERGGKAIEVSP